VDRQGNWPTTFDFAANYLHLDDLFQHGAPVSYENSDGNVVQLSRGSVPGSMNFDLDGDPKGEVTEFRFEAHNGRLLRQNGEPLGATVDSQSIIPLKDRDRVIYLLGWLAESCGVPGLPPIEEKEPLAYALLILERPVTCPIGCLLIASKLDFDIHSPNCRMAFFGRILAQMDPKDLKCLRILKMKQKVGALERIDKQDGTLVICKDMFKADTDLSLFMGLKIVHEASGAQGILEGGYAQEGKFKVRFPHELKVKSDPKGNVKGHEPIALHFKTYNFDKSKKILQ